MLEGVDITFTQVCYLHEVFGEVVTVVKWYTGKMN